MVSPQSFLPTTTHNTAHHFGQGWGYKNIKSVSFMKRVVQLERVSTTDAQKEAEAQAQIIV